MDAVTTELITMNSNELPIEYRALYDSLYKKISGLVSGSHVIDIRNDPATLRIIIESTMTIVEGFRDTDNKVLSGPEKKRIALTLIKYVISDLNKSGKIDPIAAEEMIKNIDFWGGIAMDVAVDAIKIMFNIGQKVAAEVGVFVEDTEKTGCSTACKKNCCIIC